MWQRAVEGTMRRLLHSPVLILRFFREPYRIITADARRWCEVVNQEFQGDSSVLEQWAKPEFRTLAYHRCRHHGGRLARLSARVLAVFYRPQITLYLRAKNIGEGFYIQHGFATAVNAVRIGRNCWVSQQVTVGHGGMGELPILEDGVRIYVGAKVIGKVTVGANTKVGANAVVVKDVPPNCTVIGVPGRIVKRDGIKVDEAL